MHFIAGGSIVIEAADITLKAGGGFVRITAGGVTTNGGWQMIQRGAPGAMLANALLSGMRTLAAEKHAANAIATGEDATPEDLQHWIALLSEGRGVTGELIHVGAKHVGKVQS